MHKALYALTEGLFNNQTDINVVHRNKKTPLHFNGTAELSLYEHKHKKSGLSSNKMTSPHLIINQRQKHVQFYSSNSTFETFFFFYIQMFEWS